MIDINKIKTIKCKVSEARKILIKELWGKVFHVTNEKGFNGIITAHKIMPNIGSHFGNNWGNKNNSYFRNRGCISVCDLKNNQNINEINDALYKYSFYNLSCNGEITYLMVLDESLHHHLITWEACKKEKAYRETVVPYLESGYPCEIPIDRITLIVKIELIDYIDLGRQYYSC